MIQQRSAARAAMLGLRIVSENSSPTSRRLKGKRAPISSGLALPFLLPLNTPVLARLLEHLRTMAVDELVLVEIVAVAIAKGQL